MAAVEVCRFLAVTGGSAITIKAELSVLDALEANVAVLDLAGQIVAVNKSWRRFARANGYGGSTYGVGQNYFHLCAATPGSGAIAEGIRQVLAGQRPSFSMAYECFSPEEIRWCSCTVTPFVSDGWKGALVAHTDVTEAFHTITAVEAQKDSLKTCLNNIDQGISHVDRDLNVVSFNRRFLEILNLPADAFAPGDPFERFVRYKANCGEYGPGDIEQQVAERMAAARKGEPHRLERTRPDGSVIEIVGRPLDDGGFVTTYTDITHRVQQSRQVEETAALVQRITANLPGVVFRLVMLETGRIEVAYCSEGIRNLMGLTAAEAMQDGDALFKLIVSDDRATWRDSVLRSAETMDRLDIEFRVHSTAGEVKWLRTIARPRRSSDGTIVWDGLSLDISDRKKAETAIRVSEQRFRDVADVTSDWIWEMDEELRFTYLSDRWAEITGLDPNAVLGRTRRELGWADPDD